MLFALVLNLSLAATDREAVILVGRRTALSQAEGNALSHAISTQLVSAGVPVRLDADAARAALARLALKDASACSGRKACLTELGRQLSAPFIISLSLSQVGSDRSIALELLRVEDGVVLEKDALVLGKGAPLSPEAVAPFAARVRERLGATAPVHAPPDTPVVTAPPDKPVLTPTPPATPPLPVVVAPAPAPRSHTTSFVLGGAGVAALGVGVGLLVAGLAGRADAYQAQQVDGALRSPYSASVVQQKAGTASAELGIAGALAAVGLGLGAAAVLTW